MEGAHTQRPHMQVRHLSGRQLGFCTAETKGTGELVKKVKGGGEGRSRQQRSQRAAQSSKWTSELA